MSASHAELRVRLRVEGGGRPGVGPFELFQGTMSDLITAIARIQSTGQAHLVITPNVDQLIELQSNAILQEVYRDAAIRVIDGHPVLVLLRTLGARNIHRLTGATLLPEVVDASRRLAWKVAIVGGAKEIADSAVAKLQQRYPGAEVVAIRTPIIRAVASSDSLQLIAELEREAPNVVFLCLGSPKQELWFKAWHDRLPAAVYVGAGAAVDFAAGSVERAPRWVQVAGAEWIWRLAQEPRRLGHRYLIRGPQFLRIAIDSLWSRIGGKERYTHARTQTRGDAG